MTQRFASLTWVLVLVVLALVVACAPPSAVGAGAEPAVNEPYRDPDYETWVQRFERPGREVYDRRLDILKASGVAPGMSVADIGAGTGLFVRLFAKEVGPGGKVYAVDISKNFIDNVLRTARQQGHANVEGVVNTQTDTKLPSRSIDLAFSSDAYHHFEHPREMLTSIHRALKPEGRLVVVDFRREPGRSSAWVLDHVRLGKDEAIREIEAAGFRLLEDRDFLRENYFLKFEKAG